MLIKEHSFVVFSDDWGEHPSSCQHLFTHIAKDHTVLWVNTVGMRTPKLNLVDLKKIFIKVRKMLFRAGSKTGLTDDDLNLCVLQPYMLPFVKIPGVRAMNRLSVILSVRKTLKQLSMENPIVVTTVPNSCDYIDAFQAKRIVYYCIDDFSEWPGHDKELVLGMEESLITKADVFMATSDKLFQRLSQSGKPTHLLTHGVDVEHFSRLPEEEHPFLANIPKPRVGYFGLFDERFDQVLFAEIARRMPEVSFVITGRQETEASRLNEIKNIYFTGPVAYSDLPALIKGWKACLLPYIRNELTDAINPLKLKEYIATRKPVIGSPLPEVKNLSSYLNVAENSDGWVLQVKLAVECSIYLIESERRKKFFKKETWATKAKEFIAGCF